MDIFRLKMHMYCNKDQGTSNKDCNINELKQ